MRKTIPLLLLLALIPFAYQGINYLYTAKITKVGVSKSTGFGKVNPNFFVVFEDRPALRLFERTVSKAEKQRGAVNVVEPPYDVEIHYSNGNVEGLHLWLFPEETAGSFMDVTNSSTVYVLPKDIARELIKLLEPYAESPANKEYASVPAREEQPALPSEDPDASQPPEYRSASCGGQYPDYDRRLGQRD